MKPHLPILLLSALLFSYAPVQAAAPGDAAIDLGLGEYLLEGDGSQTGPISGDGTLRIVSGEVQISTTNGDKINNYTGITEVAGGATLKFTGSDFKPDKQLGQLGSSELNLSGTLLFFGEGPSVWAGTYDIANKINLKDGAVIKSADGHFSFSGGLDVASGATASMKMAWGKDWILSGVVSGSGTLNLGTANAFENKVYRLTNEGNTFSGIYDLDSSGGTGAFLALVLGNTNAARDAQIKLSGDGAKNYLVLNQTDAVISGLSGNGQIKNGTIAAGSEGAFTKSSGTNTLTINQTNAGEDIFDGTIDDNVTLTKAGVGRLTLTNIGGYAGTLGLQGGTLNLKLASTSVFNLSNLQATGGTLNLESGRFLINGDTTGSVSLANTSLSGNGATLVFDIIGSDYDNISFTGAVAGSLSLNFNLIGVQMGQSFAIMTTDSAANATNSLGGLTAVFGQDYKGELSANGNNILFTLSGYSDTLLQWDGGANGTWTNGGTTWKTNLATNVPFDSSARVLFGDVTGAPSAVITLDGGGIEAANVLVDSNSTDYTLKGGALGGAGGLTKNGTNTLTLENSNTYAGGTQIYSGQLNANAANALGTGAVELSGGVLVLGNASAISTVDGENTISFNGGTLKYGTGITQDISSKINASSTGNVIVDTNGNSVTWGTLQAGFNYVKEGAGSLTLQAGTYAKDLAVNGGSLGFASGDVTLSGKLTGTGELSFAHNDADAITISGDTTGFSGSVNAAVENLNLVNGAFSGLAANKWTLSAATKVNIRLNGDRSGSETYSLLQTLESVAMSGGTHVLTFGEGSTIRNFTQTGNGSNLTLKGSSTFDSMKVGIQHGVQAGILSIEGSVTTHAFQGATLNNARYTLNLKAGGELIVDGTNSDPAAKANASMILAIMGYGEASQELRDLTTFNMTGGTLKVENATMFFADDGHVTWNMSNGLARVKGLDMTNSGGKKSKLYLTGGTLEIGANGFVTSTDASQYVVEIGNATLRAYESWAAPSSANISLSDATTGSTIQVDDEVAIELSGVISNKDGIEGKLLKTGTGDLTLSGANAYSGGTTVNAGTLIVGAGQNSALGAGSVAVNNANLNMKGAALTNALTLTGTSNLFLAQGYAGADQSVVMTNMSGTLSLGNLAGGKISSISTVLGTPTIGTTIKDIGATGTPSAMTLNSSSLAIGLGNLLAKADDGSTTYTGAAGAVLQFSQGSGSTVNLAASSTLTLDLRDADLVAKMQELQASGNQTYYLLITNGALTMAKDSVNFLGLDNLDYVGLENGNVVLTGDMTGVYTVRTGAVKSLSDNDALNPYNRVLINGTLNLNLPGVTDPADGIIMNNLGGNSTGIINVTQNGGAGPATLVLNVDDANTTYNGVINGSNIMISKTGAGTQTLGAGLNLGDSSVDVSEGTLALGSNSTIGVLTAIDDGKVVMENGANLNLTQDGSYFSENTVLSGTGTLTITAPGSLGLSDNARLEGMALNLDGGRLDLEDTTGSSVSSLSGNGTLAMQQGALAVNMNGSTSVFTGTLEGSGTLNIGGQGTQELNGAGNDAYTLNLTGGNLIIRGDATTHQAGYNQLNIGSGAVATIGTIGTNETAPMTRLTLADGGTVSSGGTLRFVYNTNLADSLTSGPLLTTEGALNIQNGSTVDVTTLDDNLVIPADFTDSELNLVLASKTGAGTISLGNNVALLTGGLFKLVFDNTVLKLDSNGNLVLGGTARRENLFNQAVTTANTAAASNLLWNNRIGITKDSELGKLLAAITNDVTGGNLAAANHAMAASAGSTVTSLHAAQRDDFYKQQMWIRNRVSQMGVNPAYRNEDMPYVNAWIQANGSYDKLNSSGDESGYKLTTWGGTVGCDVDLSERWTVGGAFTASYGKLTADAADSARGDFDTYYANLFARMQVKKWSHSLIVSGGWNDMTLNRHVSYTGGGYSTRGTTNGTSYGAMYEATYDIAISEEKTSILQPLFNASIQKSKVDSYRESGAGNAGLDVGDMDSTTGTIGVGARLMGIVGTNLFGRGVLGEVRAMAVQDLGDARSVANVGFINNAAFNERIRGAKVGRTGAQLGGSLVVPVGNENSSIYIDVNADLRSKATSLNGNIGYRYNF